MTDTEMILWIQNRVRSLMEEKGVKSEYRLFKELRSRTIDRSPPFCIPKLCPPCLHCKPSVIILESRCPSFSLMKQKSSSARLPKPKGKSFVIFCILPTGSSRHCLP